MQSGCGSSRLCSRCAVMRSAFSETGCDQCPLAVAHDSRVPVHILVNPGHGTAGVNSGNVPAIPGRLATLSLPSFQTTSVD